MRDAKTETGWVHIVSSGAIKTVEFQRHRDDESSAWGVVDGKASWLNGSYTIGKDLFLSEQEARTAGEAARLNRLESLRKQIKKLERFSFTAAGSEEKS